VLVQPLLVQGVILYLWRGMTMLVRSLSAKCTHWSIPHVWRCNLWSAKDLGIKVQKDGFPLWWVGDRETLGVTCFPVKTCIF